MYEKKTKSDHCFIKERSLRNESYSGMNHILLNFIQGNKVGGSFYQN